MPTYVYQREDGTQFENVESINDDRLTHCPSTGQPVKLKFVPGEQTAATGGEEQTAKNRREAFEKNPYHTTLSEYKPDNPNSIAARKQEENKRRVMHKKEEVSKRAQREANSARRRYRPRWS